MEHDEIVRALRFCADKSENFEECHSGQCDCPFGKTVIDCTERMNREAADLIEKLAEAARWTPANKPPEVSRPVQVMTIYSPQEYAAVTVGMLYQPSDRRRKPYWTWIAYSNSEIHPGANWICPGDEFVIGWMPLPAGPKEEK